MEFEFVPQYHEYSDASLKQRAAVTDLPAAQRYAHFIKEIIWHGVVWGLCRDDRWALTPMQDGTEAFLLWPAGKYAEEYREMHGYPDYEDRHADYEDWDEFEPRFIELAEFTETLLPLLKQENIVPGVFFTPFENGVTPSIDELVDTVKSYIQECYSDGDEPREADASWQAERMKFHNRSKKIIEAEKTDSE